MRMMRVKDDSACQMSSGRLRFAHSGRWKRRSGEDPVHTNPDQWGQSIREVSQSHISAMQSGVAVAVITR